MTQTFLQLDLIKVNDILPSVFFLPSKVAFQIKVTNGATQFVCGLSKWKLLLQKSGFKRLQVTVIISNRNFKSI